MRKTLLLLALAALASLSFGCALTDYGTAADFATGIQLNKTHGVISCKGNDRFLNAQQTLERQLMEMLYTTYGLTGVPACAGFNPVVTPVFVDRQDAREWGRFNATYTFFGEARVLSGVPPEFLGLWSLATMKDLDEDGALGIRMITYHTPNPGNPSAGDTGTFSCIGENIQGIYGGPEGIIIGDGYDSPDGPRRLPRFEAETVVIDRSPGIEFCLNIAALEPERAMAGYSTYWGLIGRFGEGRVEFTPVTRHEGLAQFVGGGSMTVNVHGIEITGNGDLLDNGSIAVSLASLSGGGQTYRAETPIRLIVDPTTNFRTVVIDGSPTEFQRLAEWALAAGMTDRTFDLSGIKVPEFGMQLPPIVFQVNGDTLRRYLEGANPGSGDGAPGFGG